MGKYRNIFFSVAIETMSCIGSHLGFRIGIRNPNFLEDLQMIIPGQFGFNCPIVRTYYWPSGFGLHHIRLL
jgi:hypothetical protein